MKISPKTVWEGSRTLSTAPMHDWLKEHFDFYRPFRKKSYLTALGLIFLPGQRHTSDSGNQCELEYQMVGELPSEKPAQLDLGEYSMRSPQNTRRRTLLTDDPVSIQIQTCLV